MFAGSRFTRPAESRHAPIEGEALAVVHGLKSTRHFVLGCDNVVVATDYKLLLGVLNNRHLGGIKNERLLSLKEKKLPYRFSIIHIPGQKQKAPDANSRKPTVDAKNFAWIVISRSQTPSLVLKSGSAFVRAPRRGNPTHKLIWKKSLPSLRPPISATFVSLPGPRSENTPYAMTIYKISKQRSKTISRALPHDWILPRVYESFFNSRMDSAL